MEESGDSRFALLALVGMALIGVLLIFFFPGSSEQDVEYHFLMARTAWVDHFYFVDVWGRPLFTTVFAPVALLGFVPARFLALAVSVAAAWQTYRLACDLRISRAWLIIPFLLGQQTFFELYSNLFTETLFALVLVIALRCHISGRLIIGMLVASLLPLARPEGVFLCFFWGVWVASGFAGGVVKSTENLVTMSGNMSERSSGLSGPLTGEKVVPLGKRIIYRFGITVILATGVVIWWLAALLLSGDPLFILHNWPATWHTDMYGHGTFFSYAQRSQEFAGVVLIVPFIVGLSRGFRSWALSLITCVFLVLFLLHSIFVKYGLFGEAGFPRYMVSVAPAIAVLTLEGWNTIFSVKILRPIATVAGWVVVIFSILQSLHYMDSMIWTRDAVAIDEMASWLELHHRADFARALGLAANRTLATPAKDTESGQKQQPLPDLIWSNGRMCIIFNRNLRDSPPAGSREKLDALLEKASPGTIVFWDSEIGPNWFGMTAAEIEGRGYKLLISRHYSLPALIFPPGRFPWMDWVFPAIRSREIELSLLEKE